VQACACPQHRLVSVALFLNASHVAMPGTRRPLAVIPPGGVRTFLDVKPHRDLICAKTLCPFVSSTRNIALGKASATVPSISIAPSLLAKEHYLLLLSFVNEHGLALPTQADCKRREGEF